MTEVRATRAQRPRALRGRAVHHRTPGGTPPVCDVRIELGSPRRRGRSRGDRCCRRTRPSCSRALSTDVRDRASSLWPWRPNLDRMGGESQGLSAISGRQTSQVHQPKVSRPVRRRSTAVAPGRPADGRMRCVAARKTYWVMQRLGVWIVREDDVEIASLPSRTHAVAVAVQRAQVDQPSEILVLGPAGAIEERRAYGEDPS